MLSYWASTYLWDFVSFLLPSSFAITLFYIFGMHLCFHFGNVFSLFMVTSKGFKHAYGLYSALRK